MTSMTTDTAYEAFAQQYRNRTLNSASLYEEARMHLPAGVPGNAGWRPPHPLYFRDARGTYLVDIDDNEYIDLIIGGGSAILGHSAPAIVEAVKAQVEHGTGLIAPTPLVIELAKKIKEHMPGMDMVRFCNSGSEAAHLVMRIARTYTGKDKIGKFEGNFHGQLDNELISGATFAGPEDRPVATPHLGGIPKGALDDTIVLPFNNAEAAVTLVRQHAHELAAVIMEPVGGTWLGGIVAETSFVEAIRNVTREEGVLLIFDEVITGFRMGLSGGVSLSGVLPDLRAIGKIIGGGFPVGGYGGRKDVMENVLTPTDDPDLPPFRTYQSGTFTGNPVSMVAGLALIRELERPGVYERMYRHGERLRTGIRQLAQDVSIPVQLTGVGSIFGVHFSEHPVKNIRDMSRNDRTRQRSFHLGLVANGVHISPAHIGFTNAAQTDSDIGKILDVSEHVLRVMRQQEPGRGRHTSAWA
jgi:glutamate-1-semialdehyde 2,1-aminomutase